MQRSMPVSYTHLDVYKRQVLSDFLIFAHNDTKCDNKSYVTRFVFDWKPFAFCPGAGSGPQRYSFALVFAEDQRMSLCALLAGILIDGI